MTEYQERRNAMCEICGKIIDLLNYWKIYGKCFCSRKCVKKYEEEL